MASEHTDWKRNLGAIDRFQSIQKIQQSFVQSGKTSQACSQKEAFAAETEAYDAASTRGEYDAACDAIATTAGTNITIIYPPKHEPTNDESGLRIGVFQNCHLIAEGLASEVYRCDKFALKVITRTQNVEPHNGVLERKILESLQHPNIISLLSYFQTDSHQLVLQLPYYPHTLEEFIRSQAGPLPLSTTIIILKGVFKALDYLHNNCRGLIHRDVKPSNILLTTIPPTSPTHIQLIDFGTAWHPTYSVSSEPSSAKVLDVGTSCYRAPETLFGNRSYGTAIDIWATGCILAEMIGANHSSLFVRGSGEEDGNQLALITSLFKTLGTPDPQRWPEAKEWKTNPFQMWRVVKGKSWEELLGRAAAEAWAGVLVRRCIVFESGDRITAGEAVEFLDTVQT